MTSEFEQNRALNQAQAKIGGDIHGGQISVRTRGDFKPEVFFIGQIVGGTDFPTD